MGERARGVVLYSSAAALLVAGGVWWFRAAPHSSSDTTVTNWRTDAVRLLPDAEGQKDADTLALAAGADHQVTADLDAGEYSVAVVCVGGVSTEVRVSLGQQGDDSGLGMGCTGNQEPTRFTVAIADQLRMNVSVNDAGPVVFRYSVLRARVG